MYAQNARQHFDPEEVDFLTPVYNVAVAEDNNGKIQSIVVTNFLSQLTYQSQFHREEIERNNMQERLWKMVDLPPEPEPAKKAGVVKKQ